MRRLILALYDLDHLHVVLLQPSSTVSRVTLRVSTGSDFHLQNAGRLSADRLSMAVRASPAPVQRTRSSLEAVRKKLENSSSFETKVGIGVPREIQP